MDEELDLGLLSLSEEFESDIDGEGILDEDICPLIEGLTNQASQLKREEG